MLAVVFVQWAGVLTPLLLLIFIPLLRMAIRGALRDEIDTRIDPQLKAIGARIDQHMLTEEREMTRVNDQHATFVVRLEAIEKSIAVIEDRSERRRRGD